MSTVALAAVVAAGAGGAVLRAVTVAALPRAGTAAVNLVGTALLAGVVALDGGSLLGPVPAAMLGLGFAGSLTTFSGWVERIADGVGSAPDGTVASEVVVPLLGGVGLVIATFVLLG